MKYHKTDGGKLTQTDMKWEYDRPNPVYRCHICGAIVDSKNYEQIEEK